MDLFTAMKERGSCRSFLTDPIDDETIQKILSAATLAPSPLNMQPWKFIVVLNQDAKNRIYEEAERCRDWALEKSGWKWLGDYKADFLKSAPVIIAVTGDPKKTGVDMFMEDGNAGYQHACAAAIQNMHLAAHAMGLGSLWFTFFDKNAIKEILDISEDQTLIALVCLGKPGMDMTPMKRKDARDKTTYLR